MNILDITQLSVDITVHGHPMPVVRDISFAIPPGRVVALVGESGSGKSITAQAIMRILPKIARITDGRILLTEPTPTGDARAVDLTQLPHDSRAMRAIRGGKIAMIFQEPMVSLSPLHTIGNQLIESIRLHQPVTRTEANELGEAMLARVGFPQPARAMQSYPFELSGGLRQRAMIACALVCKPLLLIADEPTTALDVTIQAQILNLIKDLQAELGMAVLLITHDLGVVANLADEVVVMYQGEIMEYGTAAQIFRKPAHPYLKALFNAIPQFSQASGHRLVPVREIQRATSRLLAPASPAKRAKETTRAATTIEHLAVQGLRHAFTSRGGWFTPPPAPLQAVDDVSFTVRRGECFGLVGESGCGKTTLSKILMRALTPDGGAMTYYADGQPLDVLALDARALFAFRTQMQFIFQDPFSSLNPRMTVLDIIREPLVIHQIGEADYQLERVQELMRLVGLDIRYLRRYPHSFSGGQRQRLGIARALALKPNFVICDEPVSALDVSIQAQVLNLLKDLQAELSLTTLFISHNLAVVDYVADRIAVMCQGRLVEIAEQQALFADPQHPYTQALVRAIPFPDLDRPLDFAALLKSKDSDPAAWPAPYTHAPNSPTALVRVAPDHHVQMQM